MNFVEAINQKAQEINGWAKSKGWYDPGKTKSPLESHMLMVSEIVEATEEVRSGKPPLYLVIGFASITSEITPDAPDFIDMAESGAKPEGEVIELADAVIRILDHCAHKNYDIGSAIEMKMAYNQKRPYRHGNKLY